MSSFFKKKLKTAVFAAVFCFSSQILAKPNFLELKRTVEKLFLEKNKVEALNYLDKFIQDSVSKNEIDQAKELKLSLGKRFITQEAQAYYEQSLIATIDNKDESKKLIEKCLNLEPENVECLIQKLRLSYRENTQIFKNLDYSNSEYKYLRGIAWIEISLGQKKKDFKEKTVVKKVPGQVDENSMILAILELERSVQAKNYSMAKDILSYLEKNYNDWPEIIWYKQKIDFESTEAMLPQVEKNQAQEAQSMYLAKCKGLSKSTARKYRYDFDLCIRGT